MRSHMTIPLFLLALLVGSLCFVQNWVNNNRESEPKLLRRRLDGVVYGMHEMAAVSALQPQQQQQQQVQVNDGRRLSFGFGTGATYPQQQHQQPQQQQVRIQEQPQPQPGGYGFVLAQDPQQQPSASQQSEQVSDEERPKIYTYVEQPVQYDPNDDTADLVENWRKAWYDVGWDPRVLDSRDAARLPEYQELMALITDTRMVDDKAITNYKRWMAMASVGGGWMADISTWPLNYFIRHGRLLPNDGALTIYQGVTPSLVSGAGNEYLRIAKQIGEAAEKKISTQKLTNEHFPEKYRDRVDWSDFQVLKEMKQKMPDMFTTRSDVVPKNRLYQDASMQCVESEAKRAVYLGDLRATKESTRGTIARKFLNEWRAVCQVTTVEDFETLGKKSVQ